MHRSRRSTRRPERQGGRRVCRGGAEAERSPPFASRAPESPPVSSERNMAAAHGEGVRCQQASQAASRAEAGPGGRRGAQQLRRRDREDPDEVASVRRQGTVGAGGDRAASSAAEVDHRAPGGSRTRSRQWQRDSTARPRRAHDRRQAARIHSRRGAHAGDRPGHGAPAGERESPQRQPQRTRGSRRSERTGPERHGCGDAAGHRGCGELAGGQPRDPSPASSERNMTEAHRGEVARPRAPQHRGQARMPMAPACAGAEPQRQGRRGRLATCRGAVPEGHQ